MRFQVRSRPRGSQYLLSAVATPNSPIKYLCDILQRVGVSSVAVALCVLPSPGYVQQQLRHRLVPWSRVLPDKTGCSSASQETFRVSLPCSQKPTACHVRSHINSVHALPFHFFKIHFHALTKKQLPQATLPSSCLYVRTSYQADFHVSFWGFFLKYVHMLQFLLKSEKSTTVFMKMQVCERIRSLAMKGLHD